MHTYIHTYIHTCIHTCIGERVVCRLRQALFAHMLALEVAFFDENQVRAHAHMGMRMRMRICAYARACLASAGGHMYIRTHLLGIGRWAYVNTHAPAKHWQVGELLNRLASDTAVLQNAVTVNVSMGLRFGAQV